MKWPLHIFIHSDGSLLLGTPDVFLPVWDAVLGTMWCLGEEVSSQSGSFGMLEVVPTDPSGVLSSPHGDCLHLFLSASTTCPPRGTY